MFRRKTSQGSLDDSLMFANEHSRDPFSSSGRLFGDSWDGETVKASTVRNDSVRCSVILDWLFGAGLIIEHYYGVLVYLNKTTQEQVQ